MVRGALKSILTVGSPRVFIRGWRRAPTQVRAENSIAAGYDCDSWFGFTRVAKNKSSRLECNSGYILARLWYEVCLASEAIADWRPGASAIRFRGCHRPKCSP